MGSSLEKLLSSDAALYNRLTQDVTRAAGIWVKCDISAISSLMKRLVLGLKLSAMLLVEFT